MTINSKIILNISSSDGKKLDLECYAIYIDLPPKGIHGILPDHIPLVAKFDISIFYIVDLEGNYFYFSTSGGFIDVRKDRTIIFCDTFERKEEIDKDRALKEKVNAESVLKKVNNDKEVEKKASFSLKKAINRLKILD